jgi:hypothetical protein
MPGAIRIGDANTGGGAAIAPGAVSVLINGRAACIVGTKVTPHPPCGSPGGQAHCVAITTVGSPNVLAEYIPINIIDNIDSCGHVRTQGSTDVIIGVV